MVEIRTEDSSYFITTIIASRSEVRKFGTLRRSEKLSFSGSSFFLFTTMFIYKAVGMCLLVTKANCSRSKCKRALLEYMSSENARSRIAEFQKCAQPSTYEFFLQGYTSKRIIDSCSFLSIKWQ